MVGFTSDALSRAELLQELTLPESIETLPDRLFEGCTALERLILLHRQKLCSISENTFAGAESLRILVPEEAYPLLPGRRWLRGNPLARAPGYDFFHWLTAYQQQDRIIPNVPKAAAPR